MSYRLPPVNQVIADLRAAGPNAEAAVVAAIKAWKKGIHQEKCEGIAGMIPTDAEVSELTAGLIRWADQHAHTLGIGTVLADFRETWNRRNENEPVASGLTWKPASWVKDHWRQKAPAADAALNRLEDWLQNRSPDTPLEWCGPKWDNLTSSQRLLLAYMHKREQADVADLENTVWGKDMSDSALQTALSRANNEFLLEIHYPRTLHKVRGEPIVRWQ